MERVSVRLCNATQLFSFEIARLGDVDLGPDSMSERFDCTVCKESLYGQKFIKSEDGLPHCIPCFNQMCAHTCAECKETIQHNVRELSYDGQHFHEQCLCCSRCRRSLGDERFTRHGKQLFCNACFQSEFTSTCTACNKSIQPGSKKLEYKGQTWHEECFFAPRCCRCKQVLTTGGVTYRDEAWHRHCFVCTGCGEELAGKQFTTEEDNPYCVQCFTKNYAQKCEVCNEPITGFGEGKFVTFEDRHWHHSCFSCSRCSASLVGVGFFPEKDQILCRDCSTQL
ncbi:hypothetical protein GJAV_G00101390 [Gymnothorax javanicus]|nr:hypothetical protein GJAV_G00101390 [Gymnothorax javanicus]